MQPDSKTKRRLDSLCLELASEAELEQVAEWSRGDQQKQARRILLARCQELAKRAARDLRQALAKVWPEWEKQQ